MHGPSLIVAERGKTDKKVSAELEGFSLLNFGAAPSLRGRPRAGHRGLPLPLREGKTRNGVVRARTAVCAGAARIELR